MTTWAQLREGLVRNLLADTAKTRWTDPELLVYANSGLNDLSGHAPARKSVTLASGSAQFALPADFIGAASVQVGARPIPEMSILDMLDGHQSEPWFALHWPDEGYLTTSAVLKSTATLVYFAYRTKLVTEADTLPFGPNRWMEEAIAFYVCYEAHMKESVKRASLAQWDEKPQNPVGNPLADEAKLWWQEYTRVVMQNKPR